VNLLTADRRTKHQQILDLTFDRIEILSSSGRIEAINDRAIAYFAYRNLALEGLDWATLWPENHQTQARDAVAEAASGKTVRFRAEMVGSGGDRHCWQTTLAPLREDDGSSHAIVALSRDITERLEAESALRVLTQTLQTDLGNMMRARADERAHSFALQDALESSRASKAAIEAEAEALRDELSFARDRIYASQDREHTIKQRLDIATAARLVAEQATRQAQKGAAIGQLVAGVAHDYNNMLQTIQMGLDAMALGDDSLTPRQHKVLGLSLSAVQHAATLTRRLLAFSREHPYAPATLDLAAVVGDMLPLIQHTLGSKVRIDHDIPDALVNVFGDRHSIEQALMNLCVNARDASRAAGCVIHIGYLTVEIAREDATPEAPAGRYRCMEVQDDGEGMDAATLERIFEPFFTTKPEGKGTGLGMAQVFGMMRQANGFVRVSSQPGVGTSVKLMFPALD
jgi:PAS domain S-box-containing protein